MGGSSMYTYPVVALSEWSDCMVDPGTHTQHMGQAPIADTLGSERRETVVRITVELVEVTR